MTWSPVAGVPVPAELLEIAEALLPGIRTDTARLTRGQSHEVVLLPGVAAVRVSRRATAAQALPRRTEILRLVAASGLPFAVPEPLTEVRMFGERAAVAVSWIDGAGHPRGHGDPAPIRDLLAAMASVPVSADLRAVLGEPHEYAGGHRWAEVMAQQVLPRLPAEWRDDARRRLDLALELPPVPDALVHGDLSANNVHWAPNGKLIGVIDWDLAQPFDPAVDAACMAWHGWKSVHAAVDAETYHRAQIWYGTFPIEQIGAAILNDEPEVTVAGYVTRAVAWLQRNAHQWIT